jgi:hypothetical protein
VSTSADATGTWYRYEFLVNNTIFPDYPKLSVWPDGYYLSVNQFASPTQSNGAGAIVFERSKMLLGQAAQAQYIDVSSINGSLAGMLPVDADGPTAPAAGAPEPFLALIDAVRARWPGYPPYGGAFDEVTPHLTVAQGPPSLLDQIEGALPTRLPVTIRVERVWLVVDTPKGWQRRTAFPLL